MEPKDLRYHNPTHYGVILHTLTRQGGTINDRHKLQTRYAQHLQISPHTIKNRSTELIDLGFIRHELDARSHKPTGLTITWAGQAWLRQELTHPDLPTLQYHSPDDFTWE